MIGYEILVADHPAADARAVVAALERCGFAAAWCSDGFEALQLLFSTGRHSADEGANRLRAAIVSQDLAWPDGRELLSRIRASERLRTLPVVLLIGGGASSNGAAGPAPDGILAKPILDVDLIAVLATLRLEARP